MSSKYKSGYTLDFKIRVLEYYFKHGGKNTFGLKSKTAQLFSIDHKTISRMLCNPDIVKKAQQSLNMKKSSGVKVGKPNTTCKIKGKDSTTSKKINSTTAMSTSSSIFDEHPELINSQNDDMSEEADDCTPKISVMELPEDPDYSLLKGSIGPSSKGANDIAMLLIKGTDEVRQVVINECDLIYECKVCRNLFRSVVNFLAHKRLYCQEKYQCSQQSFHKDPGISLSRDPGVTVSLSPSPPPPSPPPPVVTVGKPSIESIVSNLSASRGKIDPPVTIIPTKYSQRLLSRKRNREIRSILNKEPRIYLRPICGVSAAMFQSTTPVESDQEGKLFDIIHEISSKKRKLSESEVLENSEVDTIQDSVEEPDSCPFYSCDKCSEQFEEKGLLDTHLEKDHEVERTVFTCPICAMMFLSIGGCVKHLLKIHKKKKHQRDRLRLVIKNRSYTKVLSPNELSQLKNRSTLCNKQEEAQLSNKLEEEMQLSEMLAKEELPMIKLGRETPSLSEENEQQMSSQQEDMVPLSTLMKRYKLEEEETPISKENMLPTTEEDEQPIAMVRRLPIAVEKNLFLSSINHSSSMKGSEVKKEIFVNKENEENLCVGNVEGISEEKEENPFDTGREKNSLSEKGIETPVMKEVKFEPIEIVEKNPPYKIREESLIIENKDAYLCKNSEEDDLVSPDFLFSTASASPTNSIKEECIPPTSVDEAQSSSETELGVCCKKDNTLSPKCIGGKNILRQEEPQHPNTYRKQINKEAVYINKISTKMASPILDCRKCGHKLLITDTVSSQFKRCNCRPIKEEPAKKIEIQIRKDYQKDVSAPSSMLSNNNSSPSNPKLTNEILMELRKVCNFKSLTCIPCERKYQTSQILKRHIAQHIGWTRFTCVTCSFRTYEKYQCVQHCIAAHDVSEKEAFDLIIEDQRLEIGLRQLKNESVDLKPEELLGGKILMSDSESFKGKSSILDSLKESDVGQKSEVNFRSLESQSLLNKSVTYAEKTNEAASREIPVIKDSKKTIMIKTVTVKPSDVRPLEVANCNTRKLNVLSIKEIVHVKKIPKQDLEKQHAEDSLNSISNLNN